MSSQSPIALSRKPRKGESVTLTIERLNARGSGESRVEVCIGPGGKPRTLTYAVPRTLPGDRVEAKIRRIRGGHFEASRLTLIQPAEARIEPRCQHFEGRGDAPGCGGCVLQSLEYDDQLAHKAQRVAQLVCSAGVSKERIQPAIRAQSPWYYRNKMEFSFGVDAEGTYALGMHPAGRRYDVLPLDACYLQSEGSLALIRAVRQWGEAHGVAHHDQRRDNGLLRTLTIREGKRTGQRLVELTTAPSETAHFDGETRASSEIVASFLEALLHAAQAPGCHVDGVVWTRHIAKKGQPTRLEHSALYGRQTLMERLEVKGASPLHFEIHPRAFFQPNSLQAEVLYAEVLRASGLSKETKAGRVMDLYCGTGTIGLAMAHAAREVVGIERSPDAIMSARANARRNGVDNITFHEGDVGEVLEAEGLSVQGAVDVVVVDPPRAGLLPSAMAQLLQLAPPRLVYVSCNPASLAKNLHEFITAGWRVETVIPVDMFPQTAHIETIAVLEGSPLSEPSSS